MTIMSTMESVALKASIRAIAYRKPIILASSGSLISLWHEGNKISLVKTFQIELNQTIIGIKFEDNCLRQQNHASDQEIEDNLLIYSTHFIVSCCLRIQYENENIINCELKQDYKFNLVYWIIDCVFGNNLGYILNSRNEVIIFDLNKRKVSFNLSGPQKCILYSGKFLQCSHNGLIIASGTVFRTILLWGIELLSGGNWRQINIQALHGHDGVIFSIDYNLMNNTLISASDDRSIRIWTGSVQTINENKSFDMKFWKSNSFDFTHVYYGHRARIWKVSSLALQNPVIISCGEDSSIFVWSLLTPYQIIQKKSLFRNNRIWCFETLLKSIAFGGSDSSLKFIDIDELLGINNFDLLRNSFQVIMPKAICYLKFNPNMSRLFSSSIKGNFHIISEENDFQKFNFTLNLDDIKIEDIFNDYICVDYNFSRTKAVIASKFGHVCLLSVEKENLKLISIEKLFHSKIFDVSFVDENHIICCLAEGQISLFLVDGCILKLKEDWCFVLPVIRHPWSSCGVLVENLLIVGDYSGSVFAFVSNCRDPISQYRHIHGPNGVTCLQRRMHSNLIYSSGRNGRIVEYLLKIAEDKAVALQHLRTFLVFPEMDWIGGFKFEESFPFAMKYVYGFESRNFLVWDLVENRVVFQEECGGGHRSWDLVFDSQNDQTKLRFSYSNKNTLQSVQRFLPIAKTSPTYCSLPRKINSCSLLYHSNEITYFLIGGEDTHIQVIRHHKSDNSIQLWTILYGHISNISSIKCLSPILDNGRQIIDAISVGGRSQLIIWKFIVDHKEELICEERATDFLGIANHLNEHMLFEEHVRKTSKENDIDIRYLHVDFFRTLNCSQDFVILVACSDCAFRLYRYSDKEKRITHSDKISIGTACVLLAMFVKVACPIPTNGPLSLSICALASSDGFLSLWPVEDEINSTLVHDKPSLSCKLHQSGINSMDFHWIKGTLLVLTGGDDNCLKVTVITVTQTSHGGVTFDIVNTIEESFIHSCQITGLRFLSDCEFVSASIDQKVVRWKIIQIHQDNAESASISDNISEQLQDMQLNPIDSYISSIADVSSIELISDNCDNLVLICGEGFQLLQI